MYKKPQVSIVCNVFNHEKYIRKALEGFIMQKTSFPFEVLIHDDASTDNSAAIIREYERKFPEIIKPIYQTENQYSKRIGINKTFQAPRAKGKYIAFCEGDDYWTDPYKIQKQFDILEHHTDCSMCVHTIQEVLEDGTLTMKFRPSTSMEECSLDTAQFLTIRSAYPFQTGSFFMRTSLWLEYNENPPAFKKAISVGDEPMLLYMAAKGKIYYLSQCMSVYRVFSSSSWSSINKYTLEKRSKRALETYNMMCLYDEYTEHKYDCELETYRCNVLWLSQQYRELIKKENRFFIQSLNTKQKLYMYMCVVFPFMKNIREYRGIIKQKKLKAK